MTRRTPKTKDYPDHRNLTADECIQRMRDAWMDNLAKAKRFAALFEYQEVPDWALETAWEAGGAPLELYDRMLAHGFKKNFVTGEYEK